MPRIVSTHGTALALSLLLSLSLCQAYVAPMSLDNRPVSRTSNCRQRCSIFMQTAPSSTATISRRGLLKALASGSASLVLGAAIQPPRPAVADMQLQYGSGSFSGTSVVNGVLSAYGLPQLPDTKGYTPFLQQFKETVVEFKYPSNWVVNNKAKFAESGLKNGQTGITVSDYRTAEGLTLFTMPVEAKAIDQIDTSAVADLVVDGGSTRGSGALDYKLVKEAKLTEEGYKQYTFTWQSVTVSGYEVDRYGVAAATVKKGVLYVLFGVVAKPRAKVMGPVFKDVAESFRVFTI